MNSLKHVGTYSTMGGQTAVVFDVVGVAQKYLVVFLGADNSVVAAWHTYGWTRALAVTNLARAFGPATPWKDTWGRMRWRTWQEVSQPNLAAYRFAGSRGYSVAGEQAGHIGPFEQTGNMGDDYLFVETEVPRDVIDETRKMAAEIGHRPLRCELCGVSIATAPGEVGIRAFEFRRESGVELWACIECSKKLWARGHRPGHPLARGILSGAYGGMSRPSELHSQTRGGVGQQVVPPSGGIPGEGSEFEEMAVQAALHVGRGPSTDEYEQTERAYIPNDPSIPLDIINVPGPEVDIVLGDAVQPSARRRDTMPAAPASNCKIARLPNGVWVAVCRINTNDGPVIVKACVPEGPIARALLSRLQTRMRNQGASAGGDPGWDTVGALQAQEAVITRDHFLAARRRIPLEAQKKVLIEARPGTPISPRAMRVVLAARRGNEDAKEHIDKIAHLASSGNVSAGAAWVHLVAAMRTQRARGATAGAFPSVGGDPSMAMDISGPGWDMIRGWLWNPSYRGEGQATTMRQAYREGLDRMRGRVGDTDVVLGVGGFNLIKSIKNTARAVARHRVTRAIGTAVAKAAEHPAVRRAVVTTAQAYGVPPAVTEQHLDGIAKLGREQPGLMLAGLATGQLGGMAAAIQVRDAIRRRDPRVLANAARIAASAKTGDPKAQQAIATIVATEAAVNPRARQAVVQRARAGQPVSRHAAQILARAAQEERLGRLSDQLAAGGPAAAQTTMQLPAGRQGVTQTAIAQAARLAPRAAAVARPGEAVAPSARRLVAAARSGNPRARAAIQKVVQAARAGNPRAARAVVHLVAARQAAQVVRLPPPPPLPPPARAPGAPGAAPGARAQIVSATRLPSGQTRVVADVGGPAWDTFRRWVYNPSYRGEEQATTLRQAYREGLDAMRAMTSARRASQTPLLPAPGA